MTARKHAVHAEAPVEGVLNCIVSRKGAGKISKGVRVDDQDVTFDVGEKIEVDAATAAVLEDHGYVAIV